MNEPTYRGIPLSQLSPAEREEAVREADAHSAVAFTGGEKRETPREVFEALIDAMHEQLAQDYSGTDFEGDCAAERAEWLARFDAARPKVIRYLMDGQVHEEVSPSLPEPPK